ncbi:MAG: RHS repeat-associated core domain-containing protein, partial [Terriglobia bacterium]
LAGTLRMLTDYAGTAEESCHSLPYGNGEDCGTVRSAHLFTGKERDVESGNDYFGVRYYASSMGRFLSPDWSAQEEPVPYAVLDDPQSLNLYSYVRNNPLSRTDPNGHCFEDACIVEGIIALGVAAEETPEGQEFTNAAINAGGGLVTGAFALGSGLAQDVVNANEQVIANGGPIPNSIGAPVLFSSSSSEPEEKKTAEPPQLAAGKQAHKDEEVRAGEEPEVPLPDRSGRMDRYNKGTGNIREIKPDNPRGERTGNRQLERYKKAMEKATGRPHTTELTKYKP